MWRHYKQWKQWKQWYSSNQHGIAWYSSGSNGIAVTSSFMGFPAPRYKCSTLQTQNMFEWNIQNAFQGFFNIYVFLTYFNRGYLWKKQTRCVSNRISPPLKFPARLFKTPWSTLAIKSNEGENIFGQKYDQINPAQLIWIKQILSKFYEI